MIKSFFVLLIISTYGVINTDLKFNNFQQCKVAESLVKNKPNITDATCIEMQEKTKKLKCKVNNNFSYVNPVTNGRNGWASMLNYPYPESYECVEE